MELTLEEVVAVAADDRKRAAKFKQLFVWAVTDYCKVTGRDYQEVVDEYLEKYYTQFKQNMMGESNET